MPNLSSENILDASIPLASPNNLPVGNFLSSFRHREYTLKFDNFPESNTLYKKKNVIFLRLNFAIQQELKPIFNDMNKALRLAAFTKSSEELLKSAYDQRANKPFPKLAEYFLMVDELIQQVEMDEPSALKVRETSRKVMNQVMNVLAGEAAGAGPFLSTNPMTEDYEIDISGLDWQENLEANLPPAYQGVKKDGKALGFFLKWYRGKTTDFSIHENHRIDYVNLGMTQAHLRHVDSKLLKSLINANQYDPDFKLDTIIPSLYKKTT